MNMTAEELQAAKRALTKLRMKRDFDAQFSDPATTDDDRALMLRYPRHTLAAARLIDNQPIHIPRSGMEDSFLKIRIQETH